ncbi:hypothetical protein MTP04_39080 [Lysinibacillus sp. PLM2]|nr:hypothetical protein MTP04_39080 [Lysinibacillus sp. PLM2]
MGLKYIEHIKSIVLTILVLLSLLLTFSIWSYTPNLQIIEETPVNQISVGTEKEIDDVIKPYRILFHEGENFFGTVTSTEIDEIMEKISNWKSSGFQFVQSNLTDEKLNNLLKNDKRITLFYESEVPLNVINSMMFFSEQEVPNISFNRLIIDWNKLSANNTITIYLASRENGTLYSTDIHVSKEEFVNSIVVPSRNLGTYQEVERAKGLSLYVPTNEFDLLKYTYYIDEISPETFKNILFVEPSIVQRNIESPISERYIDSMALMTVDTNSKIFNYVYPASESYEELSPSKLIKNSFEFVNEHGGFTGDYRYKNINVPRHLVEYQLYLQGLPVYSNVTLTRISITWGDKQIFHYRRPYYLLDMDISSEKYLTSLPSGTEMIERISQSQNIQLANIDELYIGYYLTQNDNKLLYTLEPSWIAIINGVWTRLTPEVLGGDEYGLE